MAHLTAAIDVSVQRKEVDLLYTRIESLNGDEVHLHPGWNKGKLEKSTDPVCVSVSIPSIPFDMQYTFTGKGKQQTDPTRRIRIKKHVLKTESFVSEVTLITKNISEIVAWKHNAELSHLKNRKRSLEVELWQVEEKIAKMNE